MPTRAVPDRIATNQALFRSVADPKFMVTFDNTVFRGAFSAANPEDSYIRAVSRFFDDYVTAPIPTFKGIP
jgi:hypothetical protein